VVCTSGSLRSYPLHATGKGKGQDGLATSAAQEEMPRPGQGPSR
jgi:hypothetical protein